MELGEAVFMATQTLLIASIALLGGWGEPGRGVSISEIHYHPPAGEEKAFEFVEIENATSEAISLAGWQLEGGIDFEFPEGAELPANSAVVVCRDVDRFLRFFPVDQSLVFGNFSGALNNRGDRVRLVDQFDAFVDSVQYDDEAPWPEEPDGDGRSLQRRCRTSVSSDPDNWVGFLEPTPTSPTPVAACPPPPTPAPSVVISEIFYHPRETDEILDVDDDGERLEFVELRNLTDDPISLQGWRLTRGVTLTFPAGAAIEANDSVVVARNPDAIREGFGIENVVDVSYTGRLSNSGERITLVDADGTFVDSVLYADAEPWPYAADGAGSSLERVQLTDAGDDPSNWSPGRLQEGAYVHLSTVGSLRGTPTERIILNSDGRGEYLIDNVSLVDVNNPDVELVANGSFEENLDGWTLRGIAETSVRAPGEGVDGSGALRLISTGGCPRGVCGASHGALFVLPSGLDRSSTYRLSLDVQLVEGNSAEFQAWVFGGVSTRFQAFASPGQPNAAESSRRPPEISDLGRFPTRPGPKDQVWLTARVTAKGGNNGSVDVLLVHNDGVPGLGPFREVAMLDDGMHRDGVAGDGVYGAELPPFPHNTQLHYRILAVQDGILAQSPLPGSRGAALPQDVWGYYVEENPSDSPLPVYHILLDGVDPSDISAINDALNCTSLQPSSFVCDGDIYPEVGVRWRGNTMCVVDKRNFKLRFNRGRPFRGLRKMNLNSMWTDKSLVRDHLAWELLKEIGLPYSETEYIRVHLNGEFHGLFLYIEHPDERFLERNGLDGNGSLYKALQPPGGQRPIGVQPLPEPELVTSFWEEETNEGRDFSDLLEFVNGMHSDAGLPGGPTVKFWSERSIEDMIVGYQVGQVALNNIDSFAKNHFLYRDKTTDRWGFLGWDLDLSFGKFFTFCAVDPRQGRPVGTLNDVMLCDPVAHACRPPPQLDPWFTTTVGADFEPLNWLTEFFFNAGGGHYQRALLVRLWDLLEEKYSRLKYSDRLNELAILLADDVRDDFKRWGRYPSNVPGFPDSQLANLQVVLDQINCHRDFLGNFIRVRHPEVTEHPRFKITEIMYQPSLGDQDLEYVEVTNLTADSVDLTGYRLDDAVEFVFPEGAMVGAGEIFVVARSPASLRRAYPDLSAQVFGPFEGQLDDKGDSLRFRDAGVEGDYPATLDFVGYDVGGDWPEPHPGFSLELRTVAVDVDNDRPEAWSVSEPGGSPGGSGGRQFIRGDFDDDTLVNLTDGLGILNFLFLSGPAAPCQDAADSNDDGGVNLTDAVHLLNHLFLGGPAPLAPYPETGVDPTPDGLDC